MECVQDERVRVSFRVRRAPCLGVPGSDVRSQGPPRAATEHRKGWREQTQNARPRDPADSGDPARAAVGSLGWGGAASAGRGQERSGHHVHRHPVRPVLCLRRCWRGPARAHAPLPAFTPPVPGSPAPHTCGHCSRGPGWKRSLCAVEPQSPGIPPWDAQSPELGVLPRLGENVHPSDRGPTACPRGEGHRALRGCPRGRGSLGTHSQSQWLPRRAAGRGPSCHPRGQ